MPASDSWHCPDALDALGQLAYVRVNLLFAKPIEGVTANIRKVIPSFRRKLSRGYLRVSGHRLSECWLRLALEPSASYLREMYLD